jgi:hypothetical protein
MMPTKVRVNLANPLELLELPGVSQQDADTILRFRAEHGPIRDAGRSRRFSVGLPGPSERADFSPADATAPEAPGARRSRGPRGVSARPAAWRGGPYT